jgi:hypothetical protein
MANASTAATAVAQTAQGLLVRAREISTVDTIVMGVPLWASAIVVPDGPPARRS